MDASLAELEAEAFSAEHEDPPVPSAPFFPITGLPVFQTPHDALIQTSAPASEPVSGWYDMTEACFGVFDEPIHGAEVASNCEEAEVATSSTRPEPTTEVVVSHAAVADNLECAEVAPTALGSPQQANVLKGQEYERALTSALTRCAKKPKLCQPWESDLMSDIFSDQPSFEWAASPSASLVDIVSSDKPEMCTPGETIDTILLQHRPPVESCASLLRARPDQTFPQQDSSRKTRAMTMWMETVMPYWRHFQVTRSIVSGVSDTEPTAQQVLETLEATFGRKSASALYSRALAVHRYLHWCLTHGVQPFPMVERIVWSYVSELANLCRPSAASTFMRVVNFMRFTITPDGSPEIATSARISGKAVLALAGKRPVKRAPALTVKMVRALHLVLKDKRRHVYDRLCAGTFLIAVYGRCRWSDLRHSISQMTGNLASLKS